MAKAKCKLCKSETEPCYFNIDFNKYCVCSCCADNILLQTLQYNLVNKWKTYREIKKEADTKQVKA